MSKIYVCEMGCKYEGGSTFYATDNFIEAWKVLRQERLDHFNEWENDPASRKYISTKDFRNQNVWATEHKLRWESNFNYFQIKVFDKR